MSEMLYVIIGLGALCFFIKLMIGLNYRRLIREAGQMSKSEHILMKTIIKKFETCYQLKLGVENVEVFVDKYLNSYKMAGIYLYTWEVIGDLLFGVTLLSGLLTNMYIIVMQYERSFTTMFLLAGIFICGLIILEDVLLNIRFLRKKLSIEIQDYLENVCKPRLENQVFKSDEMEKYHREYFEEERAQLDELLTAKQQQEEPEIQVKFTKEEQKIIEEVLKEYMA